MDCENHYNFTILEFLETSKNFAFYGKFIEGILVCKPIGVTHHFHRAYAIYMGYPIFISSLITASESYPKFIAFCSLCNIVNAQFFYL